MNVGRWGGEEGPDPLLAAQLQGQHGDAGPSPGLPTPLCGAGDPRAPHLPPTLALTQQPASHPLHRGHKP